MNLDKEISLIKDAHIKSIVTSCLPFVPDYFWHIPSSSTGKYHPEDENVDGGLVLHTKRVVMVVRMLSNALDFDEHTTDVLTAAAIMHDWRKNGEPNTGYTANAHGADWILIASKVWKMNVMISDPDIKLIANLIACHMGRFDTPFMTEGISSILYLADYIASRKEVLVMVEND